MELTAGQINFIRKDIRQRGLNFDELADSLLDHICCAMENGPETGFEDAYQRALAGFGEDGLREVEQQTILLITLQKETIMKKTMYVLAYIAVILSTTGLLFKLQHWPGAAVMLTLGIALLNFGFLPLYFYGRYRQATGQSLS